MTRSAAQTFRVDVKGAQVREALREQGIRAILLKGRSFARLLYSDGGSRTYEDVDLLVRPNDVATASWVLQKLGFRRFEPDAPAQQTDAALGGTLRAVGALHGTTWIRDSDGAVIDIHDGLPHVHVDRETVWS